MTNAEKNMIREIGIKHDCTVRLWGVAVAARTLGGQASLVEGKALLDLQNIYSERANSGENRRSSGHGEYTAQLKANGYDPRRARELVFDYKAHRDGGPSTAQIRQAKAEAAKAKAAKASPFERCEALVKGLCERLAAYAAAVAACSDDSAKRQALNTAWQEVEPLYLAAAAAHNAVIGAVETIPPKPRYHPIAVVDEQGQRIQ
jgi:hypothetical protein